MNVTLSNSGLFYAFVHCILRELEGSRVPELGPVQHIMRNFWHRELPAHFLKDVSSLWNAARGGEGGAGSRVGKGKAVLLTSTKDKASFASAKGLCLCCVGMKRWARRTKVASSGLNWQTLCLPYGETGKEQDLLRFAGEWEVCERWEKGTLLSTWLLTTAGRKELLRRMQESTPGTNGAKWRKETSKLKSDTFSWYKNLYQ